MNRTSLFSQVFMVVVAITVGVMYISPAITKIKATQDSTDLYLQELAKVSAVNEQLAVLVAKIDSVPLDAKQSLIKYVPDAIDELIVMKDIEAILAQSNISATVLTYGGETSAGSSGGEVADESDYVENAKYKPSEFTLEFETTYEQLKSFFSVIETNNYLLEISSLDLNPADSGLLSAKMTLTAFSRKPSTPTDAAVESDFINQGMTE